MVNGWLMVNMVIQNGTQITGTQIWSRLYIIIYYICICIWDNPSHWLSYFSRWLKPPTILLVYIYIHIMYMVPPRNGSLKRPLFFSNSLRSGTGTSPPTVRRGVAGCLPLTVVTGEKNNLLNSDTYIINIIIIIIIYIYVLTYDITLVMYEKYEMGHMAVFFIIIWLLHGLFRCWS